MVYSGITNPAACRPTRRLILLGASGSVGTTTAAYLRQRPDIQLDALSVHSNIERLERLLLQYPSVRFAGITDEHAFDGAVRAGIEQRYPDVQFFRGDSGIVQLTQAAAAAGADTALTAVVGASGIAATMEALRCSLKVALANKETLVTAGPAIRATLNRGSGASILPVDSEHNAIFQLLQGLPPRHLRGIVLTASGGPFRDLPPSALRKVTRSEVLEHPTWSMGPKITVDSAGMMNKGLEIIEAHFLFSVPYEMLSACIHRRSVVHGMIETADGGFLLAASSPDMVFPVAHALSFPEAVPEPHPVAQRPTTWPELSFEAVDMERYPGFGICLAAGRTGGTAPAVLNAANEVAVELFLADELHFADIAPFVSSVLDRIPIEHGTDLGLFLEADRRARVAAREISRVAR